ncbi:MAG TPA: hypothetical protein VIO61_17440 [Anaerolineaceae bacterium]
MAKFLRILSCIYLLTFQSYFQIQPTNETPPAATHSVPLFHNIQSMAFNAASNELWMGTKDGGVQVDLNVSTYTHHTSPPLPDNDVTAVMIDDHQNSWLGTRYTGVLRRTSGGETKEFNFSSNNHIRSLGVSPLGDIWVVTSYFVYSSSNQGDVWQTHWEWLDCSAPCKPFAQGTTPYDIAFTPTSAWIVTDGGVVRLSSGSTSTWNASDGLPNTRVTSIAASSSGDIWTGSPQGFSHYLGGNSWETFVTAPNLLSPEINDIAVDRSGAVWLATNKGANRIREGGWETYTQANGLVSNQVNTLLSFNNQICFGTDQGACCATLDSDENVDPVGWHYLVETPLITLLEPKDEALLAERGTTRIRWETFGIGSRIRLDYIVGTDPHEITPGTPNSGSYDWHLPEGLTGKTTKIRISATQNGQLYQDENKMPVNILPNILWLAHLSKYK